MFRKNRFNIFRKCNDEEQIEEIAGADESMNWAVQTLNALFEWIILIFLLYSP